MKLVLNRKLYLFIKATIWLLFFVFCFYTLEKVTKRSTIIYELIISGFIMELSVMKFLRTWYKYKKPNVIDWFRLTTFYGLLLNYFMVINEIGDNNLWKYDNIKLDDIFIIPTLITILIGLLALNLAEFIVKFVKMNSKPSTRKFHYILRYKFFLIGFGLAVFIAQLALLLTGVIGYGTYTENTTSGFSFLLQIVNSLKLFFILLFGFLIFYYKFNDKYIRISYFIFIILYLLFGLLSGMKENVIVVLVAIAIPYFLAGNVIPKKWLAVFVIIFFLLYPINNNYRDFLIHFPKMDKKEAIGLAVAKTFSQDLTDIFKESSDSYSERLALYPNLQYAVQTEQDWTYYKNMDRFPYLPFSFLPRFLLPSKPVSDTGIVLNKMMTGYDRSSQTATTFGWAYLEGGIYFVLIEFFIFGIVLSLFQFSKRKNEIFLQLFLGNLTIMMLKVESDIYFLLATIIQDFIIYTILTFFFMKKKFVN